MIGVDTNVLVRFLATDDLTQNERAKRFFAERNAADPAFISAVTLAETIWVLHRRLKFPMPDIIAVVRGLLASEGLLFEHAEQLELLLRDDRVPKIDMADHLIVWAGNAAGCSRTVTFDRAAAKSVAGMELLT
jgi:predicted nucleic-acid-binding protein